VKTGTQISIDNITFGGPADYRITVKGALSRQTIECLQGMRGSTKNRLDGAVLTQLDGRLQDQAALSGVLNTLYETHVTIVSVELLSQDEDCAAD